MKAPLLLSYSSQYLLGSGGGQDAVSPGGPGGGAIHIKATVCNSTGLIDVSGLQNTSSSLGGGGAGGSVSLSSSPLLHPSPPSLFFSPSSFICPPIHFL
jgi:hypothetical protein